MARVKYSSIVADIAGSVGGATFQKNAYGSTLRSKPLPTKTRNVNQYDKIAISRAVINAWHALTAAQQLAWEAFVDYSPHYANKNANSLLSGYALFLRYNNLISAQGGSIVTAPTFATFNIPAFTATISNDSSNLIITISISPTTYEYSPIIKLTAPLTKAGTFDHSKLRLCKVEAVVGSTFEVTTDYAKYFGILPADGAILGYSITMIGSTTPNVLKPVFGTFIVS